MTTNLHRDNARASDHSIVEATVGQGRFTYRALAEWHKLPDGYSWTEATAVATDRQDHVYVFNRGDHPVIVFDRQGNFVRSWGSSSSRSRQRAGDAPQNLPAEAHVLANTVAESSFDGAFTRPHGITISPDGSVFCTDDLGHTVRKLSADGQLLMTLGTPGQPSDTGATSIDFRTIRHAGPPFHYPTNVAISDRGELFITDGYGNARVHRFSGDGELQQSWGEPGDGDGQFRVPHGIAISPDGRIFVADRENSRIQIFDPSGNFLDQWREIARPCQVAFDSDGNVYVAELGYRAGMWPGTSAPSPDATGGRVSIFHPDGTLLARWGGGLNPTAPGDFFAPHDICVDSRGDIYVAEVVYSAGGNRGLVSPTCHSLQKFERVG